jgi:hypothetical protein
VSLTDRQRELVETFLKHWDSGYLDFSFCFNEGGKGWAWHGEDGDCRDEEEFARALEATVDEFK